jgi:hypothetical protein
MLLEAMGMRVQLGSSMEAVIGGSAIEPPRKFSLNGNSIFHVGQIPTAEM